MNVFLTDFDGKRYSAPVPDARVFGRLVKWHDVGTDGTYGRDRYFVQARDEPGCNEYVEAAGPQLVTDVSPVEGEAMSRVCLSCGHPWSEHNQLLREAPGQVGCAHYSAMEGGECGCRDVGPPAGAAPAAAPTLEQRVLALELKAELQAREVADLRSALAELAGGGGISK